jgi:hypothetical protein
VESFDCDLTFLTRLSILPKPTPLRPGHSPEASCPRLGLSFSMGWQEGWFELEVFLPKIDPCFSRRVDKGLWKAWFAVEIDGVVEFSAPCPQL